MALSPSMIDAMNKATGNNVPLDGKSGTTPVQSRADQIRALGKSSQVVTPPQEDNTTTLGAETAKGMLGGAQKSASAIQEGADSFSKTPNIDVGSKTPVLSAMGTEAKKAGALLETGLGTAAGGVQSIFAPLSAFLQKTADKTGIHPLVALANSPIGQKLSEMAKSNPELAKNLTDAMTVIGGAMGDVGGGNLLNTDLGKMVKEAPDTFGGAAKSLQDAQGYGVHNDISNSLDKPTGTVTDKVRSYFAKDNIDPRLEASAKRLEDPVKTYQDYSIQAENAVKDVKADPPIAKVGENIGSAYDKVAAMRRTVGQNMADELTKVKDTPVDITTPAEKFISETDKGAGKMTSFDKELIDKYTGELKDLYAGQHPTASQVDDFLSRVPNELDVAKAAKNVTDTTNAERIIKGNLSQIRSSLTSQPRMADYAAARNAYAKLSDFLDEGSKYLGSKTGGGDYARDVSIAKSSAESILSGGKKDWLVKLEGLTGYKALDDATLAIQAMKDAGDTRGMSLFKAIGESSLSPTSLPFKMLQYGGKKIAKGVIGTPSEQTASFLKSLGKGEGGGPKTPTQEEGSAPNRPRLFSDTGSIRDTSSLPSRVLSQVKDSLSKTSDFPSLVKRNIEPELRKYLNPSDESVIKELYQKAPELATELSHALKNIGVDKIALDVKSVDSAIEKIARKASKRPYSAKDLNDVVRGTVNVSDEAAAHALFDKLASTKLIATHNDYFTNPKGGYRGMNIDLNLPSGKAELQVHTKESLSNAIALHDDYNADRASKKASAQL